MKTIDERAREYVLNAINSVELPARGSGFSANKLCGAYIAGATDQKAIDDAELLKPKSACEKEVIVPRWFLESVEDTLQIQHNINQDEKTGETCQDRNIRQSLNGLRKLLNGEELSGMERFEKLKYCDNEANYEQGYHDAIENAHKWFADYLMEIGYPDDWMRDSPNMASGKERFIKAMEE